MVTREAQYAWRAVSGVTAAKAYRLLKAILNTAVDDNVIRRKPCRIKGASQERSPERPTLTIRQVYALAEAAEQKYRALILMAAFTSLRWGELAALSCCDCDPEARTVRVTRQLTEANGHALAFGPPKSAAGRRVVAIPDVIVPLLQWHLSCFAIPGDDGLVFTNSVGKPMRHSNFRLRVWLPALKKTGITGVHFHDLRHTGNMLAASSGATMRELMDRMSHDSTKAAMIYLHGNDGRQQEIADSLSKLAREELKRGSRRAAAALSGGRRPRNGHETATVPCDHAALACRYRVRPAGERGAPGRTRTCDRLLRRQLLYPAELQAPTRTLCPMQITCRTRLVISSGAFSVHCLVSARSRAVRM